MRVWLCASFSDVVFADGIVGKFVDKTLFDEGVACFVGIVSVDAVCVGPADVV
jgi:hypothetical protein